MQKFFDSAIGKSIRALLFVFVSTGLAALVTAIQSNPNIIGGVMYSGFAIGIINFVLVFVKGAIDPQVPTFPNSPIKPA